MRGRDIGIELGFYALSPLMLDSNGVNDANSFDININKEDSKCDMEQTLLDRTLLHVTVL